MAITEKNIVITPNIGNTADPIISFSGADATTNAQTISVRMYPTNNGTLSFESTVGQLFSVTGNMTGTIYTVSDISGIPSIEVLDTGLIKLGQYGGNVLVGTGVSNGSDKVQISGNLIANVIKSSATNGNTPMIITSMTLVSNLNADYVDGLQAVAFANAAFANTIVTLPSSAGTYANAAFAAANSVVAGPTYANAAYAVANSASLYANAGYGQANTATTNAATADQKGVSAGVYANAGFSLANSTSLTATSGASYANGAFAAANAEPKGTSAGLYANAGYTQANTATTNAATADQKAVSAGSYANGAFALANTVNINDTASRSYANGAFAAANTGSTNALSAGSYANGAYGFANTANTYFYGVNAQQNTNITSASSYANGAFVYANTGVTNAATADQKGVSAGSYANSAYALANSEPKGTSAGTYANAAFGVANTGVTNAATADQKAVSAGSYANGAFGVANTGATNALSAGSYANGAFASANTKSPTAGSGSLVTVGTITTGVWNGTAVDAAHGGTGLTTITANSVVLGNGTGTILTVAPGTSGNVLSSDGTTWKSAAPSGGGQFFGSAATKAIAYNSNTISENVTVTAGNNGLSAGPISIASGFTVTVANGAVWVIV